MAGPQGKGVVDALTNTYTDVAKMKLMPDAQQHMQFLDGLMQGIMHYIQMQANATLGPQPGGGAGGMGGMGGGIGAGGAGGPMPPGPSAGSPMQIAPGGGGGMSGLMQQPDPDQLRQLLQQGPPG